MPYAKIFQRVIVNYNKISILGYVSITCTINGVLEIYVFFFK
jgi:hypothetical protein